MRSPCRLIYSANSINLSNTLQHDLNYQIGKKHSAPKPDVNFKCTLCYQKFLAFYVFRRHKNSQHGFSINTSTVDPDDSINEGLDANVKEELRSCQSPPVNSEPERVRHKVFFDALEYPTIVDEKLDHFFNRRNFAKVNKLSRSFSNLSEMEASENFGHTKTKHCWIDSNLIAPGTIWQS